jgi:hypothetical protein
VDKTTSKVTNKMTNKVPKADSAAPRGRNLRPQTTTFRDSKAAGWLGAEPSERPPRDPIPQPARPSSLRAKAPHTNK